MELFADERGDRTWLRGRNIPMERPSTDMSTPAGEGTGPDESELDPEKITDPAESQDEDRSDAG